MMQYSCALKVFLHWTWQPAAQLYTLVSKVRYAQRPTLAVLPGQLEVW